LKIAERMRRGKVSRGRFRNRPNLMLSSLELRHFRCFERLRCAFDPGTNLIVGRNAQGKTSVLEAAAVLLTMQSPRTASLTDLVQHGRTGLVLDGYFSGRHMQFYQSARRRKLALDGVEQRKSDEYLRVGAAVWFANDDVQMVRGPAEERRRFLDGCLRQGDARYRQAIRAYERALRSRNALLKAPRLDWRAIEAFDEPLVASGERIHSARAALVQELQIHAGPIHERISGMHEHLTLSYKSGFKGSLREALATARDEDARLRHTTAGPHRDDLVIAIDGKGSGFASEGQQKSTALSLRLAEARLVEERTGTAPLLLIDDVFGELDRTRRNALLGLLPEESQRLITATHADWIEPGLPHRLLRLENRELHG
jgi:DNA replication and repair protein RecF